MHKSFALEPGDHAFDGGKHRFPERVFRRLLPDRAKRLGLDGWNDLAKVLGWRHAKMQAEFSDTGEHRPSWDNRRDEITAEAWLRLSDTVQTGLEELLTFRQICRAWGDAKAIESLFNLPPRAGPDTRNFPERILKLLGENLGRFTLEEMRLIEHQEEQIGDARAHTRRSQRGFADREDEMPSIKADLLEIIEQYKQGKWAKKTPADVTCHSPGTSTKDRPMMRTKTRDEKGEEQDKRVLREVQKDHGELGSALETRDDFDRERELLALRHSCRDLLDEFRNDPKRLETLGYLLGDHRGVRDAAAAAGTSKDTVHRLKGEVLARLGALIEEKLSA
ncbi:MAG: hypothetical protein V3T86_02975 [Planctomycetota bacterium]